MELSGIGWNNEFNKYKAVEDKGASCLRVYLPCIEFKSLFPLSNQELKEPAECTSKLMHSADAFFQVCALRFEKPRSPRIRTPFGESLLTWVADLP